MPYSKFTLQELRKKFGLHERRIQIFDNIQTIEPSSWLKETLEMTKHVSLLSEKSKSELIVSPVLMEMLKRNDYQIAMFSGAMLNVNESEGLSGECDFIISLRGDSYELESPVISLVEAKDDDIPLGIPQCIAQMLAAYQYNQNEGNPVDTVFGCVTTGTEWQFLKLTDNQIYINNEIFYIKEISNLLGVWQSIINHYKLIK